MEEKKETIYRFNGDEALQKASPGKAFYLVTEDVASGKSKKVFMPILVLDVHISGGPERFYIHAFICKKTKNAYQGLKYEITADEYQKFQQYKGDKRRINLLLKASGGSLVVKKNAATVIKGIRMTAELADELTANAAKCNMSFSDYCRTLLQGKTPTVALTPDEMKVMKNIVQYRTDVMKFAGAYFKVLRGVPNSERPNYIVAGESFAFWRTYIQKGLKCLDSLIDKCK